jgi:hypothetical protein
MSSNIVKTKQGVPILRDFAGADGTPIVIDVLTGIGYYLHKNIVYPLQFGTSSVGAFSDGFSTGFS